MVMVIGILGIAIDTVGPWAWSSRVGVMVQVCVCVFVCLFVCESITMLHLTE